MEIRLETLKESERFTFGGVVFIKIGKVIWSDKIVACQIAGNMAIVYISVHALVVPNYK